MKINLTVSAASSTITTVTDGAGFALPLTADGKAVTAWTGSDGKSYSAGSSITVTADLTLTAVLSADARFAVNTDPKAAGVAQKKAADAAGVAYAPVITPAEGAPAASAYDPTTITLKINLTDKIPVAVDVSQIALNSKTYDGAALRYTGTASGTVTGGSYSGGFIDEWYHGKDKLDSAPADAGEYTLKVSVSNTATYIGSALIPVTISKAKLTAAVNNSSAYVGDGEPAHTYTVTGLVGSDKLTGTPRFISNADMKKAGTYAVSLSGFSVPSENYDSTITYVPGKLTVTERPSAPVGGGGGGAAPAAVTVPVTSNEGSVKVAATVQNNTAAVTITDAQIKEIASGKSDTGTVKMDVSSLDVKAATVPAKVIAAADSSTSATGVEVALPTGTVTLDKTALAAVSDKGGDVTVSVDKVDNAKLTETQKEVLGAQAETALVVDVTILASGEKVSAFNGGSIGVAVPYTPKAGEDTSKLVVWFINDDGSIEPKTGFYNAKTGKFEFQTQHLSQYVLVSFPFKDVPANSWYYGSAAYAYLNGLFAGTTETTFSPNRTMTRGMLVTVLYRMAGSPAVGSAAKFPDVAADAYCAKAVAWAAANGVAGGYANGGFGPGDTITREQMAAILYRYAKLKGYDVSVGEETNILSYGDALTVSEYAIPALQWACGAEIIQGSGNNLMPKGGATRAQVAAILQRFCRNIVK